MRIVRSVLAGVFVLLGVIGAFVLAALGFLLFGVVRLFGRTAARPRFPGSGRPAPARSTPLNRGDVIDVAATRVQD